MLIVMPTIILAGDTSYNVIQSVLQAVLNAISWFGLAIALGVLIWIGMKYVMSGASEKANLKGTMRNYIIGVALILTCTTVASAIASVVSKTGDNTAGGIIGKGFQLGGLKVGEGGSASTGASTPEPEHVYKPYTSVSMEDGSYVEGKGTQEDGTVLYTQYGPDGKPVCDIISGTDVAGNNYSYVKKDFNDGTNIEDLYNELKGMGIVKDRFDSGHGFNTYTTGNISGSFNNGEAGKTKYEYSIPVYDKKNKEIGSYGINVIDSDAGTKTVVVDLEEGGNAVGSIKLTYHADGSKYGEIQTVNGKILQAKDLNVEKLDVEGVFYNEQTPYIGAFNTPSI